MDTLAQLCNLHLSKHKKRRDDQGCGSGWDLVPLPQCSKIIAAISPSKWKRLYHFHIPDDDRTNPDQDATARA